MTTGKTLNTSFAMMTLAWPVAVTAKGPCLPADASMPTEWTTPFPPHRVIGNLYAVGTADLGVFLIATPDGHILINTGLVDSTALIRDNIARLGF